MVKKAIYFTLFTRTESRNVSRRIAPLWDLTQAMQLAKELEDVLAGDHFRDFLARLYGSKPDLWSDDLTGIERLRAITNYFTRMRFAMQMVD